jgi:hypothetical protein
LDVKELEKMMVEERHRNEKGQYTRKDGSVGSSRKVGRHHVQKVGHVNGRLTVVAFAGLDDRGRSEWFCVCSCDGRTVRIKNGNLKDTKSCGCLKWENGPPVIWKHGHWAGNKKTTEYMAWDSMIGRCYRSSNPHFNYYGGRGITVCDRWRESFIAFLEDMGLKPSPDLSLDRINVNGNYEPGNCRWATQAVQANNKRKRGTATTAMAKKVVASYTIEEKMHDII